MQKDKKDWFKELYSEVPSEFPPDLIIKTGTIYKVIFKEKRPRIVTGGFRKKTAVINVLYNNKLRSLYVGSNVDLARQVWNLWRERNENLKGCAVTISKLEKKGRNWMYEVKIGN